MDREISGYFEVKDFLGKHIPNFGYPITVGEDTGVGMELATMDGQPETLQDAFVAADVETSFDHFIRRFDRSIQIITQRLYGNTKKNEWVMPYHQFELNTSSQLRYLKMNAAVINTYLSEDKELAIQIDGENLGAILTMVASNDDGVVSETCISHGDLNYQNIICDKSDNIWFIDWTHCGRYPIELDFAKLENDVKFVISKDFDSQDLPNLKKFEEYLLSAQIPNDEKDLPKHLKFVKWDLRYRKILHTVHTIRKTCFSLKQNDSWLIYRVALLKFALHTLSFDKRRDMGECEVHQLAQALISCQRLLLDLVSDDFHLKIRGERPLSYPLRQRIGIDMSPWRFKCPEYSPPYHVDASVLENEENNRSNGWADPEDINKIKSGFPENLNTDAKGFPLHPRGRTGIAGRGLLGRWGANPAVTAVILRADAKGDGMELLLGKHSEGHFLWLPRGFVLQTQDAHTQICRVIHREFGWDPGTDNGSLLGQGLSYDPRQTDNAWVEMTSFLFRFTREESPGEFNDDREFEEVSWWPVTQELIKNLNPSQAPFLKEAMKQLKI
jgi:ADP-ribose pyrophosphatase